MGPGCHIDGMMDTGCASAPSIFSRCSLPPWALASQEFQNNPWPIEIVGTREAEARLFQELEGIADPDERGKLFHAYTAKRFHLDEWVRNADEPNAKVSQHSYLRFLRSWGADSNSRSGAVLKSWVESRFGLRPTYHDGLLASNATARDKYARDSMHGAEETMGVTMQLDLLYTFCQYELLRRLPEQRWVTLFRGTHDPEEYMVTGKDGLKDPTLITLNNLSSFSSDKEIAWEFGSLVWKVQIPIAKIVFFSGLLPSSLLQGENEYLVLGGDYRVERLRY